MFAAAHAVIRRRLGSAAYATAAAAGATPAAARYLAFAGSAAAGTYVAIGDAPRSVAYTATVLPTRLGRDVVAAVGMLAGRWWRLSRTSESLKKLLLCQSTVHPPGFPGACSAAADYKTSLRGLSGEELAAAKHECHLRGAQRLLALCEKNGGVYIKLGQHIGMLVRKGREEG